MPDDLGSPLDLPQADLPIHPLADLFPMLPDDELADLAEDIKANGLIHPVMLDNAGKLVVDGRNRLAACRLAGVEPNFERLPEGVEPADYIASVNLARRHLSVGQRAMALAMIYPEATRYRRGGSNLSATERSVSASRLSYARTVLRVAPDDLAPAVLSGSKTLDAAFAEVTRRQQAAMSEDAQLARLRAEAPDVAALVVEGTISLSAGLAELDVRARNRRSAIEQGRRSAAEIVPTFVSHVAAMVAAIELGEFVELDKDEKAQLRDAIALLKSRRIS